MNYRYWNWFRFRFRFRFPASGNVTRTKKHLDFCCFKSLSRKNDKHDFRDLSKKPSMKQETGYFFLFFGFRFIQWQRHKYLWRELTGCFSARSQPWVDGKYVKKNVPQWDGKRWIRRSLTRTLSFYHSGFLSFDSSVVQSFRASWQGRQEGTWGPDDTRRSR